MLLYVLIIISFFNCFRFYNFPFSIRRQFSKYKWHEVLLVKREFRPCNNYHILRGNFNNYDPEFEKNSKYLIDFEKIVEVVKIFFEKYRNFQIPTNFVVPNTIDWPSEFHGFNLGKKLKIIFSSPSFYKYHPDKVSALVSIGLDPSLKTLLDDWDLTLLALRTYKKIHGNLSIKTKFMVPFDDPWPIHTRGMKLGLAVSSIRTNRKFLKGYPERKQILDQLDFPWSTKSKISIEYEDYNSFLNIIHAVHLYKQKVDSEVTEIPVSFKIPFNDSSWPQDIWGLELGKTIRSLISSKEYFVKFPERKEALKDLGLHLQYRQPSIKKPEESVHKFMALFSALKSYKQIYGNVSVPKSFIIPESEEWPREYWNMKLGALSQNVKSFGSYIKGHPERM